jgi:DNA-binding NtrC family response regulator
VVAAQDLDLSRLAFLVDILLVRARCDRSLRDYDVSREQECSVLDFLFTSSPMRGSWSSFAPVAPLETTILLTGETGTGKTHWRGPSTSCRPAKTKPFW